MTSLLKERKKTLLFALALFSLLVVLSQSTTAFTGSGTGVLSDPFLITNCSQLNETRSNVTAKYALANNVDCAGWNSGLGFATIGTSSTNFNGGFDGRGYNISNLYINSTSYYQGLFGYTGTSSNISNVGLIDANVSGSNGVGALVGYNKGKVNNSFSTGNVTGTSYDVGGLIGHSYYGSVNYSYSSARVNGTQYVGGLVGQVEYGQVYKCYATGNLSGNSLVGGLAGYLIYGTISYSYSTGNIVSDLSGSNMTNQSGGFVGQTYYGTVNNSYTTGSVLGYDYLGGFVGFSHNCQTSFNNCFARGNVTAASDRGAFMGYGYYPAIRNSYATGYVNAMQSGGFVFWDFCNGCANNFFDMNTSNQTVGGVLYGGGATGKNTTQMKNVSTYTLLPTTGLTTPWDFAFNPYNDTANNNFWYINESINDGYPFLVGVGIGEGIDAAGPEIALVNPVDNYTVRTSPSDISFNCSLTDATAIANVSLIVYNSQNASFPLTYSTNLSSTSNYSNWTLTLYPGSYNWNCFAFDSLGNYNSTRNNTLYVDDASPNVTLNSPAASFYNDSWHVSNVSFNCTSTDNIKLNNVSLYLTDSSNSSFALNRSTSITGVTNTTNWTVALGLGNYSWNCLSFDYANNSAWSGSNRSLKMNFSDTTAPAFNNLTNQTIGSNQALGYFINSTDYSGVSCFTVNDSTNFNVNCSGYLRNNSILSVGLYWLNVTVNDSWNNLNYSLMWVNVTNVGHVSLALITPTGDVNVTQNQTFTVSVNVSCSNANCGQINVSLDPLTQLVSNGDFETGDLTGWATSGSASWAAQSTTKKEGSYAGKAGTISNSQNTIIERNVSLSSNASLTFWWKVSSESGCDFLGFCVNKSFGASGCATSGCSATGNMTPISGTVDWTEKTLALGAGAYRLLWYYAKDGSVASGSDTGWLDNVSILGDTGGKGGLVSNTVGATPFFATESNPTTISLNEGDSYVVNWTVNGTGEIDSTYAFLVYANLTSDMTLSNTSSAWNVTITNETGPIPPSITIVYPLNNTNYNSNVSAINYVVSGSNLSNCWYSIDGGQTNSSTVSAETNFSGISSVEDRNAWTVYCNNTNVTGSKSVVFYKDTVYPQLGFVPPTSDNASTSLDSFVQVNASFSDTSLGELTYNWNGTNYTAYNASLVLMMNFDNVSVLGENDTFVVDNSKYGNNGSAYYGAAYSSSGKYGGAFDFDGVDDQLNVSTTFGLGTGNFSIELWANLDSASEDGAFVKIGDLNSGFGLGVGNGDFDSPGNHLILLYEAVRWIDTSVDIGTGWHHVVLVLNSTGYPTAYVDGIQVYSSGSGATGLAPAGGITYVGGYYSNILTNRHTDFSIDELRIWNKSLSAGEAYAQYASNFRKVNSTNWVFYVNQSKNSTNGLDSGNYSYQLFASDNFSNSNQTEQRIIAVEQNSVPTVSFNSPLNNSISSRTSFVLLNASAADSDGSLNNLTLWLYGTYFNGTTALLNASYNQSAESVITFNWTGLNDLGRYNWTVIAGDGRANSSSTSSFFDLINFTVSCEAGGNYQQSALVLFQGNVTNNSLALSSYAVNVSLFYSNNSLNSTQNLTTASDGGFQTTFSSLPVGSYLINATASYQSYDDTCADSFSVGSPVSFVLDKIVSVKNTTNTSISYNITLRVTNTGGSDASFVNLTDSDSSDSPYSISSIPANSSVSTSYLKQYSLNSSSYNSTLAIASVNATDPFSSTVVSANSTEIILSIPSSSTPQLLTITKNAYYNSENSTSVNYSLSITAVNSGGVDLSSITLIDSDLGLSSIIDLNRTQNYSFSGFVYVDKASSNTNKLFVKTSATVNSTTYYSNQIQVRIPGYGGPADAIVYAPESTTASTAFNTVISVVNQNPSVGQDFTVSYWITDSNSAVNYSSGQQTIYVAAFGTTNLTASLTSPSSAGNYLYKAVVSWGGETASAYDSFTVTSSTPTISITSPVSFGVPQSITPTPSAIPLPTASIDSTGVSTTPTAVPSQTTGASTRVPTIKPSESIAGNDFVPTVIVKNYSTDLFVNETTTPPLLEVFSDAILFSLSDEAIERKYSVSRSELLQKTAEYIIYRRLDVTLPLLVLLALIAAVLFKKTSVSDFVKRFSSKQPKDPGSIENFIGLSVYSSGGELLGKIKDVDLEGKNPRIHGWLIELDAELAKSIGNNRVMVDHDFVLGVKQIMVVDKKVLDYLKKVGKSPVSKSTKKAVKP